MVPSTPSENPVHLSGLTAVVSEDLADVLKELGAGDHRFHGTSFGRGECDLPDFLRECSDCERGYNLPTGRVPQSTYCLVNSSNRIVGLVRLRHRLNEQLLQCGGHIGYYVRRAERGKGYGKMALQLALEQARCRGIERALLTVNPLNILSRRVVVANGGVADGQGINPVSGEIVDRFWIQL